MMSRRSVTLPGQQLGKGPGPLVRGLSFERPPLAAEVAGATDHARDAPLGEGAYRRLPTPLGQEAEGGYREIVVGVSEPRTPFLGEQKLLGRTTPTTCTTTRGIPHAHFPVRDQRVQVPAYRGLGKPEVGRHHGGGDRSMFQ